MNIELYFWLSINIQTIGHYAPANDMALAGYFESDIMLLPFYKQSVVTENLMNPKWLENCLQIDKWFMNKL